MIMMKNKKGFTLIELLIVIAIITILAAAVVVGINPARHFRNARHATRWNQMNSIATAIYSYAVEHGGAFPVDPDGPPDYCIGLEGTPVEIGTDSTAWCADDTTTPPTSLIVPDYLHALPKPPLADGGEVYKIEFVGEAIKITASSTEAIDDEVFLIQ